MSAVRHGAATSVGDVRVRIVGSPRDAALPAIAAGVA